ncbi:hypothetical protein CMV24_23555 [Pseudomonas plecoglossicida]|uniref:Uncharacterized protein n=1 Tax=Pseudomonas plecoglossicida TaxID=70775 RepID=A0A2A3LZ32_PSEDL|nr:hypothetical protein CMV24_23555 [Pseudomonas plecoglossicida]
MFESVSHSLVGAGAPAKQATRRMAPAPPVFAGLPAPTGSLLIQLGMCSSVGDHPALPGCAVAQQT